MRVRVRMCHRINHQHLIVNNKGKKNSEKDRETNNIKLKIQ